MSSGGTLGGAAGAVRGPTTLIISSKGSVPSGECHRNLIFVTDRSVVPAVATIVEPGGTSIPCQFVVIPYPEFLIAGHCACAKFIPANKSKPATVRVTRINLIFILQTPSIVSLISCI